MYYQMFDRNGDGKITADELKTVMHNLGETLTDEEIDQVYMCLLFFLVCMFVCYFRSVSFVCLCVFCLTPVLLTVLSSAYLFVCSSVRLYPMSFLLKILFVSRLCWLKLLVCMHSFPVCFDGRFVKKSSLTLFLIIV